jgi:hypothetical protein
MDNAWDVGRAQLYKNNILIDIVLRGISPKPGGWRYGGRSLLPCSRESLVSLLVAEGRAFGTTGTRRYATATPHAEADHSHR